MNWAAIAASFVGLIVTIVGVVLGWYVFPMIVDDEIAENVILYNDTEQFERFEELPIPLDLKVHIFQVTNPDEVNNGGKPEVEERGPYIYKESRQKVNITWDDKRISYYQYHSFDFDQEGSGELKKDDTIVVLDPALNAAVQILELTGLNFILPFLGDNSQDIFNHSGILMETTVQKFLFDGIPICELDIRGEAKEENLARLVACIGLYLIPTKNIRPAFNNNDKVELIFSLFGHKNGSHDGHYTIHSGIDYTKHVGWIEQWEDKEYLPYWIGEESSCNQVRGRDAVIFQPQLTKDSSLTIFNTDICRVVEMHYTNEITIRDASALEYRLGPEILESTTEDNGEMCYCLNVTRGITQDNGCMRKGIREIFTCFNAPILLSYPHLLWADNIYKTAVKGLKPDVDKHKTYAVLEPNTGTPLEGSKRVQFNMFVRRIEGVKFLESFDETRLVPIVWIDEGFKINDELYGVLYDMYISKTYLITGVTWGVIALGIAVIVITVVVALVLSRRRAKTIV